MSFWVLSIARDQWIQLSGHVSV